MKTYRKGQYEEVSITLPKHLVNVLDEYAKILGGTKSDFIADAIEEKIEYLHKVRHTAKMRESYRASAQRNNRVSYEWRYVDSEVAQRMDKQENRN